MSKLKSSGKVPDESCEDDDQCGAHKRCRNKVCVEGEKEMVPYAPPASANLVSFQAA